MLYSILLIFIVHFVETRLVVRVFIRNEFFQDRKSKMAKKEGKERFVGYVTESLFFTRHTRNTQWRLSNRKSYFKVIRISYQKRLLSFRLFKMI